MFRPAQLAPVLGLVIVAMFVPPDVAAEDLKPETFEAKGVKNSLYTQGQGEPVVLIHGLHSSSRLNWEMPGLIVEIATKHHVKSLDLPFHGASEILTLQNRQTSKSQTRNSPSLETISPSGILVPISGSKGMAAAIAMSIAVFVSKGINLISLISE